MQGRLTDGAPRRTALALAVDGHRLEFRRIEGDGGQAPAVHHGRHPGVETPLEGQRVEQAEDTSEGVVRGDTAGQGEDGLEPVDLGVGVAGDLFPAIGAAGDGADGYEDDLVESVESPLLAPGVRQLGEVVEERGRIVESRRGQGVEADGHGADVPEESCDSDDRYYRRRSIPGQPDCTGEASQAYPERRAYLSWCVSPATDPKCISSQSSKDAFGHYTTLPEKNTLPG